MRNNKGFTLTELMVVVGISVLVLLWGLPAYSAWKNKHDVENQILRLYGDLQFARMTAYSQKVITGVWWGGGVATFSNYQIRTDGNNDADIDDTGTDLQLGSTVNSPDWGITPSVPAQPSVSFDGRGFLGPANPLVFSISSGSGAAIDCVDVSSTRIIVGKLNGVTCTPK